MKTISLAFAIGLFGCSTTVEVRNGADGDAGPDDTGTDATRVRSADGAVVRDSGGGAAGHAGSQGGHRDGGKARGDAAAEPGPDAGTSDAAEGSDAADGGRGDAGSADAYDPLWDPEVQGCPGPGQQCGINIGGAETPGGKIGAPCCRDICRQGVDWGDGKGCEKIVTCAQDPTHQNCAIGNKPCQYDIGETCTGVCLINIPHASDGYCVPCTQIGTCKNGDGQIVAGCAGTPYHALGEAPAAGCQALSTSPNTWCC